MKIIIKGYLKNLTENETNSFQIPAIKRKNKISYIINNEKYTLNILPTNKLILIRENNEIKNTLYFELNKTLSSVYTIKENNLTIEIAIKTLNIVIKENTINIIYLVKDSNNKYEYNIEMSD